MDKYNKDIIAINDVGVKSPNYDAYGLFRALHSHNPSIIFTVLHHLLRLPADPDYPSEVQYLPSYLP